MNKTREKKARIWQRDDLDWYVEPTSATDGLLGVERFQGTIWDPCCGQGNICNTVEKHGYRAVGSDVVERVRERWTWVGDDRRDFLKDFDEALAPNVCMNPPFFNAKGAEAFIRKALALATGKVAAFVDVRFIAGGKRAIGLFADHTPHRIWIVTPRVSCPPGEYLAAGNKAGGGSADWCWLVWDMTAPAVAHSQLGWIRLGRGTPRVKGVA